VSPSESTPTTPSSSPPNRDYVTYERYSSKQSSDVRIQESQGDEDEEPHEGVDKNGAADTASFRRRSGARLGPAQPDTLRCATCSADLAFARQIVSKGFTGRYGRAYLVSPPPSPSPRSRKDKETDKGKDVRWEPSNDLVNTKVGRPQSRQLVTGAHVVADISCVVCDTVVGWKYVDAKEAAQRYKIGKFILETRKVVSAKSWEDVMHMEEHNEPGRSLSAVPQGGTLDSSTLGHALPESGSEEEVTFDSEDEDECEDLFSGVWDPDVVKKRRERRVARARTEEPLWGLV
jgi:hypothetical protein